MEIAAADIARASALVSDLARLDPSELSDSDLMEALDALARVSRWAAALEAHLAAEIARQPAALGTATKQRRTNG
ncbi:hypothetical protein [Demequina lutea]|uniref:Uncharacterized protein n=1 Tax=Demequina lutea TaxID=431489 RepID=A0A7Z0CHK7_9MICO|nr:hypothetical protein [Demequina lutea]NYI40934.1 hypothetical protein [Demequina lutea]